MHFPANQVFKGISSFFVAIARLNHASLRPRPRRLPRSRAGQGRGGAFGWHPVRAGCRPRPARSGGAAEIEQVRMPMQLDRDLRSGEETTSKAKQTMNMTTKNQWQVALLA